MPNDLVKSYAKKSGKSIDEVEKIWNEAKAAAEEKGLKDDKLYSYANAMLQKKLGIAEETSSADIPNIPVVTGTPSGYMPGCGTPYFDCDEDLFYNLHLKAKREPGQWFTKYYQDSNVAAFAKNNKGQSFYLRYDGMARKVK